MYGKQETCHLSRGTEWQTVLVITGRLTHTDTVFSIRDQQLTGKAWVRHNSRTEGKATGNSNAFRHHSHTFLFPERLKASLKRELHWHSSAFKWDRFNHQVLCFAFVLTIHHSGKNPDSTNTPVLIDSRYYRFKCHLETLLAHKEKTGLLGHF